MSLAGVSRRAALLATVLVLSIAPLRADDDAHKLAEKFAGGEAQSGQGGSPAREQDIEARRKAEEARKRDAERAAQDALKEQARRRAEAALKAERDKQRPVARKADTPAKPPALHTEEADILARAKLEEEQRKAAEKRDAAEHDARRVIEEAESASRQLEELLAKTAPPPAALPPPASPPAEPAVVATPAPAAPQPPPAAQSPALAATPAAGDEAQSRAREAEAEIARQAFLAQARRVWRQAMQRTQAQLAAAAAEQEKARIAAEAEAEIARQAFLAQARRVWRQAMQRTQAQVAAAAAEKEKARIAAETRPPASVPPQRAEAPPATADTNPPAPAAKPVVVADETRAPQAPAATPAPVAVPQPVALEATVTVLMVMQPGTYGIRRNNKTADPILCLHEGCYVSAGAGAPARFLPGRKALGVGNTLGGRAGACRNHLGCVFRGIPVREAPLLLQPVDMHVLKHDRRRAQAILADSHCRLEGTRLACARGIYAEDVSLWIVPESLAASVGPEVLERAVRDGLNGPRSASLGTR